MNKYILMLSVLMIVPCASAFAFVSIDKERSAALPVTRDTGIDALNSNIDTTTISTGTVTEPVNESETNSTGAVVSAPPTTPVDDSRLSDGTISTPTATNWDSSGTFFTTDSSHSINRGSGGPCVPQRVAQTLGSDNYAWNACAF